MKLDINRKYALSFGLVSLVVVAAMVASFVMIVGRRGDALRAQLQETERAIYEENQGRTFLNVANYLSQHLFQQLYQLDIEGINRLIADMKRTLPLRSFRVADETGMVLTDGSKELIGYGERLPADLRQVRSSGARSERTGSGNRITFVIRSGAVTAGYGEIVFSEEPLHAALRRHDELVSRSWKSFNHDLVRVGVAGALVVLLIAGLLSTLFSRTLTQPLVRLRKAANRVARGDLSCRVMIDSRDEIGELAASFNRMVFDLRQSTENLQNANRKLKALDRLKSDVISIVSHELRTPLTSIKAFAELLIMKPRMAEARKMHLLEIINSESERLARLINDMLDLAKLEEGKLAWRIEPVSIDEVIRRSIDGVQALADNKGLFISQDVTTGLPSVPADRDRIAQVVTNLLSNAIKFTRHGGNIRVRARHEPYPRPQVVVSVTDTGVGIPPESLSLIFEKFQRAGEVLDGASDGTGLGLSIARQIVEHHGGQIWAESTVGSGSTFVFTIPLDGAALEQDRQRIAAAKE